MICISLAGRARICDAITSDIAAWYHLYTNDPPITTGLTAADLEEPDYSGYEPQPARYWAPAVLTDQTATAQAQPILWTRGSGGRPRDVMGYYVTDGRDGPLLWAERGSSAPYLLSQPGDELLIIPTIAVPAPPGLPCPAGVIYGSGLAADGIGTWTTPSP